MTKTTDSLVMYGERITGLKEAGKREAAQELIEEARNKCESVILQQDGVIDVKTEEFSEHLSFEIFVEDDTDVDLLLGAIHRLISDTVENVD